MQRCDVVALITEISSEGWGDAVTGAEDCDGTANGGFVGHVVISKNGRKKTSRDFSGEVCGKSLLLERVRSSQYRRLRGAVIQERAASP